MNKIKIVLKSSSKVPPRPAGQRTEPEPNTTFQGKISLVLIRW